MSVTVAEWNNETFASFKDKNFALNMFLSTFRNLEQKLKSLLTDFRCLKKKHLIIIVIFIDRFECVIEVVHLNQRSYRLACQGVTLFIITNFIKVLLWQIKHS